MKKFLHTIIFAMFLLPAIAVFAQPTGGPDEAADYSSRAAAANQNSAADAAGSSAANVDVKLQNPINVNSFEALFQNILSDIIIPVSAAIGVVFIIWAGFKFVTAQGEPGKISEARKNLIAVLIGVALVIGAEVILDLLLNTLTQVADVNP